MTKGPPREEEEKHQEECEPREEEEYDEKEETEEEGGGELSPQTGPGLVTKEGETPKTGRRTNSPPKADRLT